jgi:hypothetical protein
VPRSEPLPTRDPLAQRGDRDRPHLGARDDFFTFFSADKALQDWDLDNDEFLDGIVNGAHDCGIDGIWTFVDKHVPLPEGRAHRGLGEHQLCDRFGSTSGPFP